MVIYAGLDVPDKSTHICVVGGDGGIVWRGVCATDPQAIAKSLRCHASGIERVVPVVCICARHAKGVLSTRVNKSDPHDAEGLAQLARTGWFKAVRIK